MIKRSLANNSGEENSESSSETLNSEEEKNDDESSECGMNIWKVLLDDCSEAVENILKKLRLYILFCRSLKRDPIFCSVKYKIQECMEDIDPMDSEEALDYVVNQSSIEDAVQRVGSGMYLSPYSHRGRGVMDADDEV